MNYFQRFRKWKFKNFNVLKKLNKVLVKKKMTYKLYMYDFCCAELL